MRTLRLQPAQICAVLILLVWHSITLADTIAMPCNNGSSKLYFLQYKFDVGHRSRFKEVISARNDEVSVTASNTVTLKVLKVLTPDHNAVILFWHGNVHYKSSIPDVSGTQDEGIAYTVATNGAVSEHEPTYAELFPGCNDWFLPVFPNRSISVGSTWPVRDHLSGVLISCSSTLKSVSVVNGATLATIATNYVSTVDPSAKPSAAFIFHIHLLSVFNVTSGQVVSVVGRGTTTFIDAQRIIHTTVSESIKRIPA